MGKNLLAYTMNEGTDTIAKLISHCNLITFPQTRNAKRLQCFEILNFHNCWNLNLVPTATGAWYQEWNILGVRAMVAESN